MTDQKADELIAEAEKKLAKFALFTSNEEKFEKARDRFLQAATMYKASSAWDKAANAYMRASDMSSKNKQEMDYADDRYNAALMYQKIPDSRALGLLQEVVDIYDKNGKFANAAKICVAIAEQPGTEDSVEWFEKAMRYYKNEGSKVVATDIVLRIAQFYINKGDYGSAESIYDRTAKEYLDDRNSRGGARKVFFNALLCKIADLTASNLTEGTSALRDKFQEYQELDTQFTEHTREHMLILAICDALEAGDVDAYSEAVADYDNICPLDDVKTKMLLRGKQALRSAGVR